MSDPCFFGYGSLVNRATHDYHGPARASVRGWRRAWRHTALRPYAYLTAVPSAHDTIHGLIAAVPGADWAALDAREFAYDRIDATPHVSHDRTGTRDVAIYAIPDHASADVTDAHPILLSYLDVVVQGYLREFGPSGPDHFFGTTDGWHAPILDDRAAPIYSRAQMLTGHERDIVDASLKHLRVTLI